MVTRMRSRLLAALVSLLLCAPAVAGTKVPPFADSGPCAVTVEKDVPAVMRDGVVLRADVYRPATKDPVPVILMRTQYGKTGAQVWPSRYRPPAWFASQCYIVVIQDVRGQYASEGAFYEYVHEAQDGYDTVEWVAHLPGALPKVGMYGSSYVGATQWLAASETPPSLKTIIPANTGSDFYDGWTFEDGAFRLGFIQPWMMESIVRTAAKQRGDDAFVKSLQDAYLKIAEWMRYRPYQLFPPFRPSDRVAAPYYFDAIKHSSRDDYWDRIRIEKNYGRVNIPVLAFEGWYDAFLNGGLRNFVGMIDGGGSQYARANQRIVIGPWEHEAWGRPDAIASPRLKAIGPIGDSPINELSLAWFDHFLKGIDNGVRTGPRVDYFVMGENKWHVADAWPIPGTRYQTWFMHSGGNAASSMGDGALGTQAPARYERSPADRFVYEPWNPVASVGGHSCCLWTEGPQGQFDQTVIEQRPDVLVYTSQALERPLLITGPVTAVLYASSTARDTDFTAKLVDVFPDGSSVNLNNGIQVARFRESLEKPSLIEPDAIYRYEIHVWPTSNLFKAGHRIRLEISSSDFPQFAPNPNTGEPFGQSEKWQSATQTIFHDQEHPSALILPVIAPEGDGAGPPRL